MTATQATNGLYTLDLGNTALKLVSWSEDGQLRANYCWAWRSDPEGVWRQAAEVCLVNPAPVGICSVVPSQTKALLSYLEPNQPVIQLTPGTSPLLKLGAYPPDQLGADRWLNAIAASSRYPHQPVVVISMGTATTVDWVQYDGQFRGGVILPGLKLFATGLSQITDCLPAVDLPSEPTPDPGMDTIACLQAGIALGYSAMINGIIDQWEPGGPVIITGGEAQAYLAMTVNPRYPINLCPLLTHEGMRRVLNTMGM